MQILLTNDDGIYAPGLMALREELAKLGEVSVVAPAIEQSGVGHSITFLTPLMAKEVYQGGAGGRSERIGWAVEGSPADCVKLALAKFVPQGPDLVVSGINGGLNVGINVLYSGTVAAATEAALNDLPSIAVSLEYDEQPRFDRAAPIARRVIEMMLKRNAWQDHLLYNLNIPTSATQDSPASGASAPGLQGEAGGADALPAPLQISTMNVSRWPAEFEERRDPKNRRYYWASGTLPDPKTDPESDLAGIRAGKITLTPLTIDRTKSDLLDKMRSWELE
ncbi:MAG: 5'/3'-nucleotidase SurE [Planctomycetota bacterium]